MRTKQAHQNIETADNNALRRIDDNVAAAARRWKDLDRHESRSELFDEKARRQAALYENNIESYIGTVSIPVGLAGPLLIHGESASSEYRVPLATTEAALVASYNTVDFTCLLVMKRSIGAGVANISLP